MLGDGHGGFKSLWALRFTGDGQAALRSGRRRRRIDVVTANYTGNSVTLLRGHNGTFTRAYPVGIISRVALRISTAMERQILP